MADFTMSVADKAIKNGVETEKCVVPQYKTSLKQKEIFEEHLQGCNMAEIPIEWVIDIADESNGWFFATAYKYDDQKNRLFVMVPDKENPTFTGWVALDYRTIHIVTCEDKKTDALFNKIVRDSVVKIKWEVEWFEEEEDEAEDEEAETDPDAGQWIPSIARYYLQILNQLLVEDSDESNGPEVRSYIMLPADNNLKLIASQGDKHDDFYRLVREGIVISSDELKEKSQKYFASAALAKSSPSHRSSGSSSSPSKDSNEPRSSSGASANNRHSISQRVVDSESSEMVAIKKLADASTLLKKNITILQEEREAKKKKMFKYSKAFRSFAIEKDLIAANALFEEFSNLKPHNKSYTGGPDADADDVNAEEALTRAAKIEEGLESLLSINNDDIQPILEEMDTLRKTHKSMLKILEIREKEILKLSAKLHNA